MSGETQVTRTEVEKSNFESLSPLILADFLMKARDTGNTDSDLYASVKAYMDDLVQSSVGEK